MDPFTLMSLIGAGVNLIGNAQGGQKVMPEQINPLTNGYYQDILGELNRWNGQQNQYQQQANQARGQLNREAGTARDIRNQQSNVAVPGANDWFTDFMDEQIPGYRAEAQQVAEMATRGGSAGQAERAQIMSEQAARNAANQFAGSGGMFSGATSQAVAEGAASPLARYQDELGKQYQNAFMGAYTPLAGQGQQLAYQGQQDQFQNTMNQLGQMLSSTQLAGNLFGNAMGGAQNAAGLAGQRAQGAEGYRHDIAQPFYATPNYQPNQMSTLGNDLSNFGTLGAGFIGNPANAAQDITDPGTKPRDKTNNDWLYGQKPLLK